MLSRRCLLSESQRGINEVSVNQNYDFVTPFEYRVCAFII